MKDVEPVKQSLNLHNSIYFPPIKFDTNELLIHKYKIKKIREVVYVYYV